MALSAKALDQILSAVGAAPTCLNRHKLRMDLIAAERQYRIGAELRRSEVRLQRKLERAATATRRLKVLLADCEVYREIAQFFPYKADDPKEIVGQLVKAIDRRLLKPPPEPAWKTSLAKRVVGELALNERSAFEWLAGQQLPKLFNRHFKSKPSARNAKGEPDTPFIRFAISAIKALGISHNGKPYSPESVVRAMTSARTGKKRRRV